MDMVDTTGKYLKYMQFSVIALGENSLFYSVNICRDMVIRIQWQDCNNTNFNYDERDDGAVVETEVA